MLGLWNARRGNAMTTWGMPESVAKVTAPLTVFAVSKIKIVVVVVTLVVTLELRQSINYILVC